jgi:hypothetical protein
VDTNKEAGSLSEKEDGKVPEVTYPTYFFSGIDLKWVYLGIRLCHYRTFGSRFGRRTLKAFYTPSFTQVCLITVWSACRLQNLAWKLIHNGNGNVCNFQLERILIRIQSLIVDPDPVPNPNLQKKIRSERLRIHSPDWYRYIPNYQIISFLISTSCLSTRWIRASLLGELPFAAFTVNGDLSLVVSSLSRNSWNKKRGQCLQDKGKSVQRRGKIIT